MEQVNPTAEATLRRAAPAGGPPVVEHRPTPRSWRLAIFAAIILLTVVAYAARQWIGVRGQAAVGVLCFVGMVAGLSTNLRAVNWRTVVGGFALQIVLALFVLKFSLPGRPAEMPLGEYLGHVVRFESTDAPVFRPGYELLRAVGGLIQRFLEFSLVGAKFVFGQLADQEVMNQLLDGRGFVFAFTALPVIVFVSSFFTLLYYIGVLPWIVKKLALAMMHIMGTSGAESLSAVANVFMGQTEAPLIVKPYVLRMTRSELLALMVGGMATISGGLMAVYIQMGADEVAILATSVMAAPCGLYLAKIMIPETAVPETHGKARVVHEQTHANAIDALAAGASDGMMLAFNVAAMLIAFLACIALLNALVGGIKPTLIALGISAEALSFWPDALSLDMIFSWLFAPLAFLMGAQDSEVPAIADLLGTKLVANEFVSYVKLTTEYRGLSPRSYALATYALTGFANLGSIGIQLGGIGAMAPNRRGELASLGGRALLCGFLATLINASIAGMFMG